MMMPLLYNGDWRPKRTSPQSPPIPAYESRDAQKPVEALGEPLWPLPLPESMLTPVSITTKARIPPPRLSLTRKPRREPKSNTLRRLLALPAGSVAPVACHESTPTFARPEISTVDWAIAAAGASAPATAIAISFFCMNTPPVVCLRTDRRCRRCPRNGGRLRTVCQPTVLRTKGFVEIPLQSPRAVAFVQQRRIALPKR